MFVSKLKDVIKSILIKLPLRNIVLFESVPDLSDNTKPVFDELVKRGYNKKYRFIWMCYDATDVNYPEIENVEYFQMKKNRVKSFLLGYSAKIFICCNLFLGAGREDQINFYLTHGTPLKNTKDYYNIPEYIDYCIAASNLARKLNSWYFNYLEERTESLGYPRNDILTQDNNCVRERLIKVFGSYNKFIVWYPTFRQHKKGYKFTDSDDSLPIIHDKELSIRLNETAKKNSTLIIMKPHFAQDVSYIKDLRLSNIRFIDDNFFKDNAITSYEFIASCDAMISDYSSVYYDYLLCNKPIGLIWEDIEEYKKKPGLIENYEDYCAGGVKLYNIDELCHFVENVANGVDELKEERNRLCDIFNYSRDGKNTGRVVDFIIEKAGL